MDFIFERFKKDYDELFLMDPIAANLMLLFLDFADDKGKFELPSDEKESKRMLIDLMSARFEDPTGYQL